MYIDVQDGMVLTEIWN